MLPHIEIEHITQPDPEWIKIIRQGLYQYNREQVGSRDLREISLVARDENGRVVGGLIGGMIWGWLMVEVLWVSPHLRQGGHGSRLLAQAEEIARQQGCRHALLETFSFQALEFYLKQGYTIYGQLDDFPPGHSRYSLKKDLSVAESPSAPLSS